MRKIKFLIVLSIVFLSACGDGSTDNVVGNDLKIKKNDSINEKVNEQSNEKNAKEFEFAYVAANKYIVLDSVYSEDWYKGVPSTPIGYADGRYTAVTDVEIDEIPEYYKGFVGKTVKVGGSNGEIFEVKISSLKIMAECIPHFGTVQAWNGEFDGELVPDSDIAMQIFEQGSVFLVAEFEINDTKDNDIIFAVPESENPIIYPSFEDYDSNTDYISVALEYLSATDVFSFYQNEYVNTGFEGSWWESEESWSFPFFIPIKTGELYFAIVQSAGNSCGGDYFYSTFSVVDFIEDEPRELIYSTDEQYTLLLAVDIDGDGELEYILNNYFGKLIVIKKEKDEWVQKYEWEIPYLDCPC